MGRLHKRQEDTRQRLDRQSRTLLRRLRIWRIVRSLRELVGAVRGRKGLVEGWHEGLDRYHKGERDARLSRCIADGSDRFCSENIEIGVLSVPRGTPEQ